MTLIDLIPIGRTNAIRRAALCQRCGMGDRKMRDEIKQLRDKGIPVLNNQDGSGYYISNDPDEIRRWQRQEMARATKTLRTVRNIEKYLSNPDQIEI